MAQLSQDLHQFFIEEPPAEQVTLASVLELAGERTFGFLFVLLALPSALPIPAAGYSVPFGIVMLLLAVQLIVGAKTPWLPSRIMHRPIAIKRVQGFVKSGIPWMQKIERVSKPRLTLVCTTRVGRVFIGLAIALMSISMMIPIPGTNTLPAIGIFVTGFGLLDDDGAISLAGMLLCLFGATLTLSILYALSVGGSSLYDWLRVGFKNLMGK
ncbi:MULTISPECIES: exopolysaccharide biosynthesis protein [Pseudanabaena]|uniref:exopolysaccharide biosynthesis protein n=1 Tax=Pseudanabaena TaxID=1152 RepID=UPI002478F3BD|nr:MULTISPECIES: exopolysaccharide biosynthesis protein [Pseudanabaena]MEA5487338.1 exopolysaccharide biosynthesis protein [Pseudanabaena sp. CCNP1317]WGS73227.1 exopolysaccharide biosynthesis protein [Pseudanabaena galeata CCNP1313]